mgnify:CR=1 FL=1
MDKRTPAKDWYATAFNALYPVIYAHRTVEAAAPEAEFAAAKLQIQPADRVLDLCCGNGRHMVQLRKHAHVAGLDYSRDLLHMARTTLGESAHLVRADIRRLPFHEQFDAITNFFTSFGYFPSTEENMSVAQGIARALKPGGRFFMDYLNPAYVKANLEPRSVRDAQDLRIEEERWIDESRKRINKRMRVFKNNEEVMLSEESVRLYEAPEMEILLKQSGLQVNEIHGDYDGAPYSPDQPRMLLSGRRIA